jgi:Ca2+-binding EF-hand superfamily protein
MGDLNKKMKFTFNMYDFDNDGYISPEDIRIIMSYMPFKRNIQLQNVSSMLESKGMDDLMS